MNVCRFNSQTPVPRLISRLGEREGNAMLNEKRRKKKILSLSFGMVIFPAHILAVAMRTRVGGRWRKGEASEGKGSPERCTG